MQKTNNNPVWINLSIVITNSYQPSGKLAIWDGKNRKLNYNSFQTKSWYKSGIEQKQNIYHANVSFCTYGVFPENLECLEHIPTERLV